MSTEDDICLWCQDSLAEHGLVIELTTEDFKQMFKHDASCKIIHYACFKDYQKKRAKDSSENEQKRASEQTERMSSPPDRSRWFRIWRVLFAALNNQSAEIRLAAPAWPGPLPDFPYFCALQVHIASPIWPEFDTYRPHLLSLPRGRTMFRPVAPEHYFHNNPPPSLRASVPFQQQYQMPISQPSFQPQPSRLPQVHSHRDLPPHMCNRFTPQNDFPYYFSANSNPMMENSIYYPDQLGIPPNCDPRQLSQTGMYNRYSAVRHSRSYPGYQSVYEEHTQCHWSAQSHNRMYGSSIREDYFNRH